ncbi:hypothetical protein [Gloeobacter violaceus]|uniref:Gsl0590 protein n=1 Tax=Gloeobacter violaceus (strain ATCC 29082 / PCC 7421) TaxID=251221 RepID=Q7NN24_GLOVI|nr:hypothetical protein [Gloeobacter violaceus]BAC88531.1 gsl0590 [Gloeobacter violaceus PCC 7421]
MNRQSIQGRCPQCGSTSIRISRRRGIERLAPFFGLSSHRCCCCAAIFFVDTAEVDEAGLEPQAPRATVGVT